MQKSAAIYARELYGELQERLHLQPTLTARLKRFFDVERTPGKTLLGIEEVDSQWYCKLQRDERLCNIRCPDTLDGTTYTLSFELNGKPVAYGRSADMDSIIAAVTNWLNGKKIQQLYERYDFVDKEKRGLAAILATVLTEHTDFNYMHKHNLKEIGASFYFLLLGGVLRSCRIYYPDGESDPRYVFSWSSIEVFETAGQHTKQAILLIKRWILDHAAPSKLQKEFPEIDFGRLTNCYDEGKELEREFILGWDQIEEFYRDLKGDDKTPGILQLLKTMRGKGFDKTLRPGTSLYSFIVSRSFKYGLRTDQPRVRFEFYFVQPAAMKVSCYREDGTKEVLSFERIEYNEAIEGMLKELERVELS